MRKFDLKIGRNNHTIAWGTGMEKIKEILDGLYEYEDYFLTYPNMNVTEYVFPSGFRTNNIVQDIAWGESVKYEHIVQHEYAYYGN